MSATLALSARLAGARLRDPRGTGALDVFADGGQGQPVAGHRYPGRAARRVLQQVDEQRLRARRQQQRGRCGAPQLLNGAQQVRRINALRAMAMYVQLHAGQLARGIPQGTVAQYQAA